MMDDNQRGFVSALMDLIRLWQCEQMERMEVCEKREGRERFNPLPLEGIRVGDEEAEKKGEG